MKRFQIVVTGKVQGVCFRWHTRVQARKRGCTGYVKNQPDGSVEIEVQGDEEAVREFIEWCGTGAPRAQVGSVSIEEIPCLQDNESFCII